MSTVADDLDKIQEKTHDNAVIWTRSELLRYYNEGYRDILARSKAFKRVTTLDIPGRFTYTHTYDWEERHTSGKSWKCFLAGLTGVYQCTYLWEAEQIEEVTPTNSLDGITQQWERAYSNDTDRHFLFGLLKDHDRINRVAWDDMLLGAISVRELDERDDAWMRYEGEPIRWSPGTGQARQFEIYRIRTTYQQGYDFQGYEAGVPRYLSGDRSYTTDVDNDFPVNSYAYTASGDSDGLTQMSLAPLSGMGYQFTFSSSSTNQYFTVHEWEKEMVEGETTFTDSVLRGTYAWESSFGAEEINFAVGLIRQIVSSDRQYLPIITGVGPYALLGGIRGFGSTADAISVIESVVPDTDLTESDRPEMIPSACQKYLRYYTLYRAFGRLGEGHNPELAFHYRARYERGVLLMKRLTEITQKDRVYAKEPVSDADTRPPRVRLPSSFERVF